MNKLLPTQDTSTTLPPEDSAVPTWVQFSLLLLLLVLQRILMSHGVDASYSKTPQVDAELLSAPTYFTTKYLPAAPATLTHTSN